MACGLTEEIYPLAFVCHIIRKVHLEVELTSKDDESYWRITQEIDPLIGRSAKVIAHPLIQWGLDPNKEVKISECTDARTIDLGEFDFVIAERYFQEAMRGWSQESMSRLKPIYRDDSKTYSFIVYKIQHAEK